VLHTKRVFTECTTVSVHSMYTRTTQARLCTIRR